MSKKIHIRPGKSQSKAGFVVGIIFCLIGLFVVIPTFGIFGIFWTFVAGVITFIQYRNGFTDKPMDSRVIEIEDNGKDVTVTSQTGFGMRSYKVEGNADGIQKSEPESVEERLKKLTNLYVQSLITREEYEQKKKDILDDL